MNVSIGFSSQSGRLSDASFAKELHLWKARQALGSDIWRNEVTRETWYFGNLTNDGSWEMYETMEPGGFVNVAHQHPGKQERVTLLEGKLYCDFYNVTLWPLGTSYTLSMTPGDWVLVDQGQSHRLRNADDHGHVVMRVQYNGAKNGDEIMEMFRILSILSKQGYLSWFPFGLLNGVPDPFHTALIWQKFPNTMRFWFIPPPLQHLWSVVGSAIAKSVFGYHLQG